MRIPRFSYMVGLGTFLLKWVVGNKKKDIKNRSRRKKVLPDLIFCIFWND